jgi:hypothetical protein
MPNVKPRTPPSDGDKAEAPAQQPEPTPYKEPPNKIHWVHNPGFLTKRPVKFDYHGALTNGSVLPI